jgi:hypothetical protein
LFPSNPMRTKTLRRGDMIAREMVLEVVKRVDEANVRYLSSIGRLFSRTAPIAWNGRRGSRLISACDELRGLRGSALKHPRRSPSTRKTVRSRRDGRHCPADAATRVDNTRTSKSGLRPDETTAGRLGEAGDVAHAWTNIAHRNGGKCWASCHSGPAPRARPEGAERLCSRILMTKRAPSRWGPFSIRRKPNDLIVI